MKKSENIYEKLQDDWIKLREQVDALMVKAREAWWTIAYDYEMPRQNRVLEDIEEIQSHLEAFSRCFNW